MYSVVDQFLRDCLAQDRAAFPDSGLVNSLEPAWMEAERLIRSMPDPCNERLFAAWMAAHPAEIKSWLGADRWAEMVARFEDRVRAIYG